MKGLDNSKATKNEETFLSTHIFLSHLQHFIKDKVFYSPNYCCGNIGASRHSLLHRFKPTAIELRIKRVAYNDHALNHSQITGIELQEDVHCIHRSVGYFNIDLLDTSVAKQ